MFQWRKNHSSSIAKDRLKLLLLAERIDCSPATLVMLKQDMARTVNKYVLVDEKKVHLQFSGLPKMLTVTIPLQMQHARQK